MLRFLLTDLFSLKNTLQRKGTGVVWLPFRGGCVREGHGEDLREEMLYKGRPEAVAVPHPIRVTAGGPPGGRSWRWRGTHHPGRGERACAILEVGGGLMRFMHTTSHARSGGIWDQTGGAPWVARQDGAGTVGRGGGVSQLMVGQTIWKAGSGGEESKGGVTNNHTG